jgi:hypothetical protein
LTTKSASNNPSSDTTKTDEKAKSTKKMLIYVGVGLVVLVGGYFAYRKFKK